MKTFEKCIRDKLFDICKDKINNNQHGFLPQKSCNTQMINFVDNLSLCLNKRSQCDVIYFDFAKAFDSVCHDKILYKLKSQYNIDGLLLKFIQNYLKNRQQRVLIDNEMSHLTPAHSGVPQGSILGPLLFVLFINDISDCVSIGTNILLYADDTKIWREIKCPEDCMILQRDIDALYLWSQENLMNFHPEKCKVLCVTLKLKPCQFDYSLHDNILKLCDFEKDLGVYITPKLSWTKNCNELASKANQRLGLLKRSCSFTKIPISEELFILPW